MKPGESPALARLLDREFADAEWIEHLELDGEIDRGHIERALLDPAAAFLRRPGKAFRSRLVEITWRLTAPGEPLPEQLALLVELLHAGSLVVDDIEDDSAERRGAPTLHRIVGLPLALNTGNWLYFWPFELVTDLSLAPERELALRRRMSGTLYRCHYGQALDLSSHLPALAQQEVTPLARAIAALKTGQLMRLAATVAPVVAGASEASLGAFSHFGMRLGVGLQMLDDLGSLHEKGDPAKRYEDLRHGRVTWPWARLAGRLGVEEFRSLQDEAERVHQGDADPADLAARMRADLAGNERAETRATLEKALDQLQSELGPGADLTPLREEIARLEVSYG